MVRVLTCIVACASISALARPHAVAPAANVTNGCVSQFDPNADYFPDKARIEDAGNVHVAYHKSYKVVTVNEAYAGGPPERYLLVQCGTPPPKDQSATDIITIPISSLFVASTTHFSALVDLGRLDVLTGVSRLRDLTGDEISRRVATGRCASSRPRR
jgi:iron complex transport system substrate-binding protein